MVSHTHDSPLVVISLIFIYYCYYCAVHPSFTLRRIVEEYRKIKGLTKEQVTPTSAEEEKIMGNNCYQRGEFADAVKHYR